MFGTPITDVREEIAGRIKSIEAEIASNRQDLADVREQSRRTIEGHERQIEMLTNLSAGYAAILRKTDPTLPPPEQFRTRHAPGVR